MTDETRDQDRELTDREREVLEHLALQMEAAQVSGAAKNAVGKWTVVSRPGKRPPDIVAAVRAAIREGKQ